MFGIGGSEIIVILIVALLFLGPDKLPSAAKTISKGIRDIKKQSNLLQRQIESDEQIGGALRDIKSALRGEEPPKPYKPPAARKALDAPTENSILGPKKEVDDGSGDKVAVAAGATDADKPALSEVPPLSDVPPLSSTASTTEAATATADDQPAAPKLTLPDVAGEPDGEPSPTADDNLADLIKPAAGTVAKGS